jgi:hypothetical protein
MYPSDSSGNSQSGYGNSAGYAGGYANSDSTGQPSQPAGANPATSNPYRVQNDNPASSNAAYQAVPSPSEAKPEDNSD